MIYTTCAMFSVVKFPNLLHISIFVGMHKLDRANFLVWTTGRPDFLEH